MKGIGTGAEGRLYGPMVTTIAAVLFACGLALGIQMIAAVIGPFRFLAPDEEEARRAFGLWTIHVRERSAESGRRLRAWRSVAPRDRPVFESFSLDELARQGVRAVAIPGGRKLSRDEAVKLRSFLRGGGGAVLTGSVGVTTPGGDWRGYALMERLIRVAHVAQVDRDVSRSVAAAWRGPLSSRLAPAEAIPLIPEAGAPAIADGNAELRWNAEGRSALGASRRVTIGRGRLAWLSIGPESARSGTGEPWNAMTRLVRASIDWASGVPSIEVLSWPGGAPFAARVVRAGTAEASGVLEAADALRAAADTAERTGSFARLVLPPHGAGGDALERLALGELGARDAWIAREGEVRRWVEARSSIGASVRRAGPRRLLVDVSNRSRDAVAGVALRVYLNRSALSAKVGVTTLGQEAPLLEFRAGEEQLDLDLPPLPPRGSVAYYLDLTLASDLDG